MILFALVMLAAGPVLPPPDPVLGFADDLLVRGEAWRAIGEYERYLADCGACVDGPHAELQLAAAWRLAGDPAGAARRLEALAEKHPDAPEAREARRQLGAVWAAANDPGKAADAELAFVKLYPDDPGVADMARYAARDALHAHDPARVKAIAAATPGLDPLVSAMSSTRAGHRSPLAAGLMSAVLPGAGQVYAGRYRDGIMSFAINALFVSSTVLAAQKKEYGLAGVLGGTELLWYGGNVVGALNAAHRYDAEAEDARWRGLEKKYLTPEVKVSVAF